MSKRSGTLSICLNAILLAVLATGSAAAATIGICDNAGDSGAGNGSCAKSVSLSGNTLTITLTNTTPVAFGGFLTADAFWLPSSLSASLSSTTNANFFLSQNPSVNPFDNQGLSFNWLLSATGNDWEGGGNPSGGIPTGSTATFVLALTGPLAGLTEAGIVTSEAIRFRGFDNGGSDKDLITSGGSTSSGSTSGETVPEPGSLAFLGTGLVLLASRFRSRYHG